MYIMGLIILYHLQYIFKYFHPHPHPHPPPPPPPPPPQKKNIIIIKKIHGMWSLTHALASTAVIGSDNGLAPTRRQAIIWTNGVWLNSPPD